MFKILKYTINAVMSNAVNAQRLNKMDNNLMQQEITVKPIRQYIQQTENSIQNNGKIYSNR
jgi:hypothetical protein